MTSVAHPLTRDPGRLPAPRLLARFIGLDVRLAVQRIGRTFGLLGAGPIDHAALAVPDTPIARAASELAREVSPAFLFHHAARTWCFAAAFSARDRLRVDREVLYVAAILHDLGLTGDLAAEPGSFEWVGARAARRFCVEQGMPSARADLVHEAVALHSSVGIASGREPEVALVHLGAGCDVLGLRLDEVPAPVLSRILAEWPRLEFKTRFPATLSAQVTRKPRCHIAGHVVLGFERRLRAAPFDE